MWNDFLDAVEKCFAGMDLRTLQPIDCFDIFPLYAEQGTARLLEIIDKSKGMDKRELAEKMHCPSVIRVEMLLTLIKAKLANTSRADQLKIAGFYDSLLKAWCHDPHLKQGKNTVHEEQEVLQLMQHLKPATPEIAKALGRLSNSCYNLSYGLYSDINPQICYETFGPYKTAKPGEIFVIKQFQNMKPAMLWGSKTADTACHTVRIYCVYKNVQLEMDAATHAIFQGDLINNLKQFAVEIDGRITHSTEEIKQTTQKLGLKAIEMWEDLTSLDFEQAKVMYLNQRCYNYINLCRRIGMDWRPTQEMLDAVKHKQFPKDTLPDIPAEKNTRFWRMMCDPRLELADVKKEFKWD
jgi:hypothetical protein